MTVLSNAHIIRVQCFQVGIGACLFCRSRKVCSNVSDAGDKPTELFPARGHQVQHCFVAGYVAGHRRRTGDACLREDLEGEALVYELLCFEVLYHGHHKISRQCVPALLVTCNGMRQL